MRLDFEVILRGDDGSELARAPKKGDFLLPVFGDDPEQQFADLTGKTLSQVQEEMMRDTIPAEDITPTQPGAADVGGEPAVDGPDAAAPPAGSFRVRITCAGPLYGATCEVLGELLPDGRARVRILDGELAGEETTVFESQCATP